MSSKALKGINVYHNLLFNEYARCNAYYAMFALLD